MITKDNLADLLDSLGFSKNRSVYSKSIGKASLSVDVGKQTISYPEADGLVVNERQTCNFSANENFVVFECVHRLLEKGYKPEHIELEPKWKLGRGASGGRADILVKDNFGKPLLIIECKTAGSEFDKSWNKTLQDGDQLFSYAQQISETQFLSLYESNFLNGELTYRSNIIAHRDNSHYLAANPLLTAFAKVTDVKERFAVWRDTYKLDYTTKGIFEANIQPYQIGKDKYSIDDLTAISASDQQKKYHEFATILRQHNVSGRENAFDKLVNLFLCKLVDEIENPDDLKFYWKGVAYDNHFDLMDRLQQLYQSGMDKFLGEDITYINQNDVNNALRFIRQNPDATQRAVWNLFIQQKFFTNNDFSFIDVHNERLFYQNAEVLLKILQMWQDIRLTSTNGHNQFLGDMFEGFLDQGVKQSEGQFFTPMPICRFIMMSLPLESLIRDQSSPPKAIDYACGAGHFLTELALQVQPLLDEHKPHAEPGDYHKSMIGIEKEYRLSKVAKVSAFMYGQQGTQICYGDGLINSHEAFPDVQDGTFDLLVANPPYSVRGFLETLPEEERKAYSLSDTIKDAETANSIETFFVERAKQLLKSGGVAAIILPSSILSKGDAPHTRAREILLQYFDVVAMAEFGSGTFGKTGTNTVTMFLRRKATNPDTAEHYHGRVEEWFKGCASSKRKQVTYKDEHKIASYAAHIGVPLSAYKSLLRGEADGSWQDEEHFEVYKAAFSKSTELKALKKTAKFKALSKDNQAKAVEKRYLGFVQEIERNKLYYFCVASDQTNPVLIIRSPSATKEIKKFLGYEWSSAKGDEGIKLLEDDAGKHITKLYDGPDYENPSRFNRHSIDKLSTHVSANFDGTLVEIPEELKDVAKCVPLIDLVDFSRPSFEKQISLVARTTLQTKSRWPQSSLRSVATINPPKSELASVSGDTDISFVEMAAVSEDGFIVNAVSRPLSEVQKGSYTYFADGDIILAKITPCMENGKCALAAGLNNKIGMGSSEFHVIRVDTAKLSPVYVFGFLNREEVRAVAQQNMTGSSGHRRVPKDFYETLKIPVPPEDVQKSISDGFVEVDTEAQDASAALVRAQKSIIELVDEVYNSVDNRETIEAVSTEVEYGLNEAMNEVGKGYKIFRMNEVVDGRMVDTGEMKYADICAEEFSKYKLNKGDLLFNRTNSIEHVGKTGIFDLDGDYCFASYLVRIIPDKKRIMPAFLNQMMNSEAFQTEAKGKASRAVNQSNINATKMKNIKVPVPTLEVQAEFVEKIEAIESDIKDAQAIIDAASAKKEAILKKFL